MEPHLREVLDLLVRWVHFVAGIMWIGNSMLFNWLDRNLEKPADAKPNHMGGTWLLHGGGFYRVDKQLLEPGWVPDPLHWFMWQNFSTWSTGILMLIIVYYLGGASYMVDPAIANIGQGQAVMIGVGALVGSWLVYDGLWRSPLGKNTQACAVVCCLLLAGIAFGLCHVLSGRAAFIHVGALMGTCMTGNVWMHIIPSQRILVNATRSGQVVENAEMLYWRAKQRSIHNNYMTFPVLFTMISNHFPSTFGNALNWVVLLVLMVAGASVRHFMNIRFTYPGWKGAIAASALAGIAGLVWLTWPAPAPAVPAGAAAVTFAQAGPIVQQRCATCHSAHPTDDTFKAAPNGLVLDTPAQIKAAAARIKSRAVETTSMPLGNKTGMTPEERATLGRWIDAGAVTP